MSLPSGLAILDLHMVQVHTPSQVCPRAGTVRPYRCAHWSSHLVVPRHTAHSPSAHTLHFHTRLTIHFWDSCTSQTHQSHSCGWTYSLDTVTQTPPRTNLHIPALTSQTHPVDVCHSHIVHPPDGTHPPKMAFSLCPLRPTGPALLPGTQMALLAPNAI